MDIDGFVDVDGFLRLIFASDRVLLRFSTDSLVTTSIDMVSTVVTEFLPSFQLDIDGFVDVDGFLRLIFASDRVLLRFFTDSLVTTSIDMVSTVVTVFLSSFHFVIPVLSISIGLFSVYTTNTDCTEFC